MGMGVPLFDTATPLAPIDAEIRAKVNEVIDSKRFIFGPEVEAFEREFAAYIGTEHAVGVANGTDALVLALRALGIGPGDEVIVPSFTFFASAEPIALLGATPVWCDIDPATFVSTADHVRAVLSPRTKAVIAVHLFGNVAPIAEIEALGVPVIEDAAQTAGTRLTDGRRPGALTATLATFSFFPSKNLGAFGDGGAVTTDSAELADRIRTLRFHGSKNKQTFELVGYNSRLDAMQAAILRVLLRNLDTWSDGRRAAARHYEEAGLGDLVTLPLATPGAEPAWHLFVVKSDRADELARVLKDAGIGCAAYYRVPIHLQPAMRDHPPRTALPGTEEASRTNLAIPMSPVLSREPVDEVVAAAALLAPALQ
jgi:dTDP-4-amino-4,6-dideoxygalactose transaminase